MNPSVIKGVHILGWLLAIYGALNVGLGFAFSNMFDLILGVVLAVVGIVLTKVK